MGIRAESILAITADADTTDVSRVYEEVEMLAKNAEFSSESVRVFHSSSRYDLLKALRDLQPEVLLFTGYGSMSNKVLFEDGYGILRHVAGRTICNLVSRARLKLKWTIFSNCSLFREHQAPLQTSERQLNVRYSNKEEKQIKAFSNLFHLLLHSANQEQLESELSEKTLPEMKRTLDFCAYHGGEGVELKYPQDWEVIERHKLQPLPEDDVLKKADSDAMKTRPPSEAPKKDSLKVVEEPARQVEVFYGTNRNLTGSDRKGPTFGCQDAQALTTGFCRVSLPTKFRLGPKELTRWLRWAVSKDRQIRLTQRSILDHHNFWLDLKQRIRNQSEEESMTLIYIHGFNVAFDQAAIRTAQLWQDLKIGGEIGFYSWPSRGSIFRYKLDGKMVHTGEQYLSAFIKSMLDKTDAKRIHLIAHSMGNRLLLRVISRMLGMLTHCERSRIKQVIFAAPDVGVSDFAATVATVSPTERNTLYASQKDKALWASKYINGEKRAGGSPPVFTTQGLDTIDTSEVNLDFWGSGHDYYAFNRALISDIHYLIDANIAPQKRATLQTKTAPDTQLTYWYLPA